MSLSDSASESVKKTWKPNHASHRDDRPLNLFDETMDAILGTCTNEKMDVIKHGLKFRQLSPSKDAHLGNDFLEPSVAILLSMLAVLWIVGDNCGTWETIRRDSYSGRQCCYWILISR